MTWSLGEVRSLAMKAARGCGMFWGLAEEAGFAVTWLETRSAPGLEALAGYLDAVSTDGEWKTAYCPITLGAHLCDSGSPNSLFPASLYQPLLVAPFLAAIAQDRCFEISWQYGNVLTSMVDLHGGSCKKIAFSGIHDCSVRERAVPVPAIVQAARVPDNRKLFIDHLLVHAAKTYAPATQASRAGAGAGLNDND